LYSPEDRWYKTLKGREGPEGTSVTLVSLRGKVYELDGSMDIYRNP